jgi:thiol-disulfide isomerase/thioredoxin
MMYIMLFLALRRPSYGGPEAVSHLNPRSFSSVVQSGHHIAGKGTRKGAKAPSWVVFFHATWHGGCTDLSPVFAGLSLRYASSSLKFAKVDVRWQELADEFGIDTSGASKQLPTIIVFEDGEEVSRLPPVKPNGEVMRTTLTGEAIERVFDLERRSKGKGIAEWAKDRRTGGAAGEKKTKGGKKKRKAKAA